MGSIHGGALCARRFRRATHVVFALSVAACAEATPAPVPPEVPPVPPVETAPEPAMAVAPTPAVTALAATDWSARLAPIDDLVAETIAAGKIPGCVVAIGRRDGILFQRAYGSRSLVPERAPMTVDTVFDLASLTKPIATATSIMLLVERGLVSLDAPAAKYVPDFGRIGKGTITIRQLLLHTAGLQVETSLGSFDHGRARAMQTIDDLIPKWAPGERFAYSDVGYLVLEEVVRRVTGQELDVFTHDNVFEPLGMHETVFRPSGALLDRVAPTELREGAIIHGEVHDPRAWRLGGVAGNAGLFSTTADLARFARSVLNGGELDGRRALAKRTVQMMLAPHDVPGAIRALGWDVKSGYSGNRGDSLSPLAVGHGGYTGTTMWIDPLKDLFVIVLSNRVHPDGKGNVNVLAGRIASVAGDAIAPEESVKPLCDAGSAGSGGDAAPVATGLDVLRAEGFARLRGAHVGLITNATGRARDGATDIALLHASPDVSLVALFAPEHGIASTKDELISDDRDEATGLPIYSLYGHGFRPTKESLAGIDTLVFDVQDVGTRFYTYASTMHRAMRAAADEGLRFVVLDRPNPIDGAHVEGPVLAAEKGFVNHFPLPVRHGMTLGELALLIDADEHLGLALDVVRMQGWHRGETYDATGLPWVSPSPNLRSVDEELLYPAIGLLEGTNLSVGRGTATPFEVVGAPWIDEAKLAEVIARERVPGVRFEKTRFTPTASPYKGQECGGLKITIADRAAYEAVRTGLAVARVLAAAYPNEWHAGDVDKLLQDPPIVSALRAGATLDDLAAQAGADVAKWAAKRDKYLLYPSAPCAARAP